MAGYTPLFDSMLKGTLYGRWPHTGIWACLLSRTTREGVIDEIPESLAAAIGVPVEMLLSCIDDFMQPDPHSRTADHDGRRLALLDPQKSWGWKVLNHGKYREKARKSAYDSARVEDGRNAQRMAARRGALPEDPTGPDATRDNPLSSPTPEAVKSAHATACQTDAAPKIEKPQTATRLPADWQLTPERRAVAVAERLDPERVHAKFRDYWLAASGTKARKLDWDATWRNWCRTEADRGMGKPKAAGGWV